MRYYWLCSATKTHSVTFEEHLYLILDTLAAIAFEVDGEDELLGGLVEVVPGVSFLTVRYLFDL